MDKRLADSQDKARYLVMSGNILVNNTKITKAGTMVCDKSELRVLKKFPRYVSRGGLKLAGAWQEFGFNVDGAAALDIGISTGGFTDFLMQKGVSIVTGVDVSYGLVDLKIRNSKRLVLLERTNARLLTRDKLEEQFRKAGLPVNTIEKISLVVMDLSFISVTKVLPVLKTFLPDNVDYIVLIKPQFEAAKDLVCKGGIVEEQNHNKVLSKVENELRPLFRTIKKCTSPVKGSKGNQEYFFWLR
ncbi:MAG: TlyA family RNA methyltransferase [bacterium]|nr:TlyA family RNA methyltransferase [bacterium]